MSRLPTTEQQVDAEDWERFRRLDRLSDHWWWRPGWRPDRHYLTWFLVFDHPGLAAHVARFQQALADLDYHDPVPADGLHMTLQGIGFVDQVDPDQLVDIGERARRACADLAPFTLSIGPIAGHSAGTFLRATPWRPILALRERLRAAIATVLGAPSVPADARPFKPHVSVTYCNADVPAAETIRRLTQLRDIPPVEVAVSSVALLEQRREHHTYRWDIRQEIHL